MNFLKKLFLAFVVFLFLFGSIPVETQAKLSITGKYAICIDALTGEILYEKNANKKTYPASTTKVMTAIVGIDTYRKNDTIKISKAAAGQTASNYLYRTKVGETLSFTKALDLLMVLSSNDIAYAISDTKTGSSKDFIKNMNKKAKEIGLKNTNFTNASGLHSKNHYMTAYDLALIMKESLLYPEIMQAMKKEKLVFSTSKQQVGVMRRDKIFTIPYAVGGKTGYTDAARNTLVVYGKKQNKEIIAVTMKSTKIEQYNDIKKLFSIGFSK